MPGCKPGLGGAGASAVHQVLTGLVCGYAQMQATWMGLGLVTCSWRTQKRCRPQMGLGAWRSLQVLLPKVSDARSAVSVGHVRLPICPWPNLLCGPSFSVVRVTLWPKCLCGPTYSVAQAALWFKLLCGPAPALPTHLPSASICALQFEFFQLCEELDTEPVWVTNVGISQSESTTPEQLLADGWLQASKGLGVHRGRRGVGGGGVGVMCSPPRFIVFACMCGCKCVHARGRKACVYSCMHIM